jgi:hypothetical protein
MAITEDGDATTTADQSFLERSYLTYVVPFTTDFKLEEALQHEDGPGKAIEHILKREWLFFGTAHTPCILHTACHKRALVSHLLLIRRYQMKPSTST